MQTILNVVEDLGYQFTTEYFDFDIIPSSGEDNLYRVEAKTAMVSGLSRNRVEKRKQFDLWFAYKQYSTGNSALDFFDVLEAKEDLEDDLIKALKDSQVAIIENTMSAVREQYIIVKLTGAFIYWRDVTP